MLSPPDLYQRTAEGVMMQGFTGEPPPVAYGGTPSRANWKDWSSAGIDPSGCPASKAQGEPNSMGYDPTDYTTGRIQPERNCQKPLWVKSELTSLIGDAHAQNMKVYADIVINHNSGGNWKTTNTPAARPGRTSPRWLPQIHAHQHDFHANWVHTNDEGYFGGFPDLCHEAPFGADWLWKG